MDASVTPLIRCYVARNSHEGTETSSVKQVHGKECCYHDNMDGFTPGDEPAEHYKPNLQLLMLVYSDVQQTVNATVDINVM